MSSSLGLAHAAQKTSLRWGVISTGWIASQFSLDLLIPSSTRDAADISHTITAVASRDLAKADEFVSKVWKQAGVDIVAYGKVERFGSYQELLQSDLVDVVYIGTPHSHHYKDVHAALSAGKHVLCEKALTVNAAQAEILIDLARTKGLFFMEAVWTRFQPAVREIQKLVRDGVLGELRGVQAELCVDFKADELDPGHRMVDPELAGGALLDLGPYPWTWLALLLLDSTSTSLSTPHPVPKTAASSTKFKTGVDLSTVAVLQFPQSDGSVLQGTMTCSMQKRSPPSRVVLVEGSLGYLEVQWATYRPESYSYKVWGSVEARANGEQPVNDVFVSCASANFLGKCWGFTWEQDEVARCIRDGRLESERMPWRDTLLMMKVFDEIRSQTEFVYPEPIETLDL